MSGELMSGGRMSGGRLSGGLKSYDGGRHQTKEAHDLSGSVLTNNLPRILSTPYHAANSRLVE